MLCIKICAPCLLGYHPLGKGKTIPWEAKIVNKKQVMCCTGRLEPSVEGRIQPSGGFGPAIKMCLPQPFSKWRWLLKSCFKILEVWLESSLQPTLMMTFLTLGCFTKRLGILPRMSATTVHGKRHVSADLLQTCLTIESLITRILGRAAGGGTESTYGDGADEEGPPGGLERALHSWSQV